MNYDIRAGSSASFVARLSDENFKSLPLRITNEKEYRYTHKYDVSH